MGGKYACILHILNDDELVVWVNRILYALDHLLSANQNTLNRSGGWVDCVSGSSNRDYDLEPKKMAQ